MNNQEKYQTWIKRKMQFDPSDDFAEKVMGRITRYEQDKRKTSFGVRRYYERISAHPLGKLGLIAACAAIGFIRIVLTVRVVCG